MNRILLGLMFSIMIPMLIGTAQEAYAGANQGECIDDGDCPLGEVCVVDNFCLPGNACIEAFCVPILNGNGPVGVEVGVDAEYITPDTTALLLAGAQANLVWILPVVLAGAGVVAFKLRKKV